MNKQILIDDFIEKHPEYKGKKLEVQINDEPNYR